MLNPGNLPIEMGYTLDEFSNVLHGNFSTNNSEYRCHDLSTGSWLIFEEGSDLKTEIRARQMAPRELGLLKLPILSVSFNIVSGSPQHTQKFFEKFFKYFHKGGG